MQLRIALCALFTCATPLLAQRENSAVAAGAPNSSWRLNAGVVLAHASLPSPYASSCLSDEVGVMGAQVYGGVQTRVGLDVRARLSALQEVTHVECDLVPRMLSDGLHELRTYDEELWGDGVRTLDAQVGFTPRQLSFLRVAGGVGWELDRALPFVAAGADLHFGSRIRFLAGADVMSFRTPYNVLQEEWKDFRIVRTTQLREGVVWKRAWLFRAGAELSLGN